MRGPGPAAAGAWRLFKPYFFQSAERRTALALLAAVIVLSLVQTEAGVLGTYWSNLLYDSFEQKDQAAFLQLMFTWRRLPGGWIMPGFMLLALFQVLLDSVLLFAMQSLQIRWRAWMTGDLATRWLSDHAHYRLGLIERPGDIATDNPDQRLADDVAALCGAGVNAVADADMLSLGLGLMTNAVALLSYVVLLWVLSRGVTLFGLHIPGLMLWVALLFSAASSLLTWMVGRPLIALRFAQQRHEADFRFGLARLRENAEAVALQGGEAAELSAALGDFAAVRANFSAIVRRMLFLNVTATSWGQAAVLLPNLLIAPLFFAGQVTLGTMVQIGQAFGAVQGALLWFSDSFTNLARWRATIRRLVDFQDAIQAARARDGLASTPRQSGFVIENGTLAAPGGPIIAAGFDIALAPHEDTAIWGRSGSGKSTLFKALAGIWPITAERTGRPAGSSLFLPQTAYLPLGTLRRCVCYPDVTRARAPGAIEQALADVGLEGLIPELDAPERHWALMLSGGEQQRLALARALVAAPDWLFLDEATASLDMKATEQLFGVLKQRLPSTTIISIAHDQAIKDLHRRILDFEVLRTSP